ncbi:MAG: AmmeMemoRadiSam system protein B [Lentisphaeria bacterium]|nr:AmmeMemoRadiSam system protein B [Lentisphaeria bacterium]
MKDPSRHPRAPRRAAAVAGAFYPESTARLQVEVENFLKRGEDDDTSSGTVRALIAPHAGYRYSGETAGCAYATAQRQDAVERVVVLAASHRVAFRGIDTSSYASFSTPLGDMMVDRDAVARLLDDPLFCATEEPHASEHSIEVQLPFLQTLFPDATLVPLLCGYLSPDDMDHAATVLAETLWRRNTLWVVSSDFTHYGASFDYLPFTEDVHSRIEDLDMGALEHILALDSQGFDNYVESTGATICGRTPITVFLRMIEKKDPTLIPRQVHYTTSGRMTHDTSHSVSYAAVVFREPDQAPPSPPSISRSDRQALLRIARAAIVGELGGESAESAIPDTLPNTFVEQAGCFVSLHIDDSLRGCVGQLEASESLFVEVMRNACRAAFHDPRFEPLTLSELDRIRIEISVLTQPRPIPSIEDFQVGAQGLILTSGRHRAVFLPQVAEERGWDATTTLQRLAAKAGLHGGNWQQNCQLQVFEATVFQE